jgi:hypothetical protein
VVYAICLVSMDDLQTMLKKYPDAPVTGRPIYIAADDKGYVHFFPIPDATYEIKVRYISHYEV